MNEYLDGKQIAADLFSFLLCATMTFTRITRCGWASHARVYLNCKRDTETQEETEKKASPFTEISNFQDS